MKTKVLPVGGIMHSKEADDAPHASSIPRRYTNIIAEIGEFLQRRVEYGTRFGIKEDKIILDPGMGRFISNDLEDSWSLLAQLDLLVKRLRPYPGLDRDITKRLSWQPSRGSRRHQPAMRTPRCPKGCQSYQDTQSKTT